MLTLVGAPQLADLRSRGASTVLVSREELGFCKMGEGGQLVEEHDLTFSGGFPVNTNGAQLSGGKADTAGGWVMSWKPSAS